MEIITKIPIYKDILLRDLEGEIWQEIEGFGGNYSVSNMGRIRSESRLSAQGYLLKSRIMKLNISSNHLQLGLCLEGITRSFLVSNLVASAFLRQKKENEYVTFKNRNPLDCRLSNLALITKSLHKEKMYKEGLMPHLSLGIRADKFQLSRFGVYEGNLLVGRICTGCFLEKELDLFPAKGLVCRECKTRRGGCINAGKNKRTKDLKESGLRECSKCKGVKKIDQDFYNNHAKCKSCFKEYILVK